MAAAKGKRVLDLAQDRPIDRESDDRLDRIPFVDNLILALVRDEKDIAGRLVARRSTGVVVGLTGKWGSGKTSILNLVAERLKKADHVAVATLNPWLFKGRDELLAAFFGELRDALGRSPQEHARGLVAAMDAYREAITVAGHFAALMADASGAGGLAAAGRAALGQAIKLIRKPKELSPQEERRKLEKKLVDANIAVVVLIDELDRVEDDEVRVVAQLVKAIGDIQGISYLVAYDPERVADALGRGSGEERRRTGEAYLEKIIQHPIPLRPLFTQDVATLLDALLSHHGLALPADLPDEESKVVEHIRHSAMTPRELKRLVGSYAVLDRMLRKEISPADLLGYCWLLTKAPTLRDTIAQNIDVMVDDPSANEISRRVIRQMSKDGKLDPTEALGVVAAGHETLLGLIFPRFGENRSNEPGARISRRRNLVRALYLGDPPGIASSDDVRKIWDESDETVLCEQLRHLLKVGELRPIIDRLDDLLPKLPEDGDANFWGALAKTFVREHDWLLVPEDNNAIAEDATTYLFRLGMRDKAKVARVKRIVEVLLAQEDLIILPDLLRKHLFRWGLTVHASSERGGDYILTKQETEDLLSRSIPIFRTALLNGTLLRRIPNCDAIFALSNTGNWDDDLRKSLTAQLEDSDGRASIAGLIVPPGYSADRPSLDQLFDADAVLARMREAKEGASASSWSEQCLRSLRAILAGKNYMFAGDDNENDDEGASEASL
jgi:ABC-type lipoprotein export system ATPase subunit